MEEETERRFHSNDTRYAVGIILVTAFVLCSGLEWQVLKWITGREDEPARPNYTYYSGYHAGAHAPKGAYYHPEELTSEDLERCSLGIKGANFPRPYKPDPIAVQSGGYAWSGDGLRTEYNRLRPPLYDGYGEDEQLCWVVSAPRSLGSQNPAMPPLTAFGNPEDQRN